MNLLNSINVTTTIARLHSRITRVAATISRNIEIRRWRREMLRDLNRRRRC